MKSLVSSFAFASFVFTTLSGTSVAYAATICVNPADASCYPTIQAGVDAASSGDTVSIHPSGSYKGYSESVSVTTPNLTIQSAHGDPGSVVIDGCELNAEVADCGLASGIIVDAAGVTIRDLTIRHTNNAIEMGALAAGTSIRGVHFKRNHDGIWTNAPADGITVEDCEFTLGSQGNAVEIEGNGTLVSGNTFIANEAIELTGDDVVAINNSVRVSTDETCVEVNGDRARIENNTCVATDGNGIEVNGNDCQILANYINHSYSDAIEIDGNGCLIADNSIIATDDGIYVVGDDVEIARNTIRDLPDESAAMDVRGQRATITDNDIDGMSAEGIDLKGDFASIRGNMIRRTGNDGSHEPAIEVEGSDNLVEANTLEDNSFAGVNVFLGDRNTVRFNIIEGGGTSGVRIESGDASTVHGNVIAHQNGEGINIGADATNVVVQFNNVWSNRTDICNEGTVALFFGNNFGTGGQTTECIVE